MTTESKTRVTLKPGTKIQIDGIAAELAGETPVDTVDSNREKLTQHLVGAPFAEYPKWVNGRIVKDAEEEAAWAPKAAETADAVADEPPPEDASETDTDDDTKKSTRSKKR